MSAARILSTLAEVFRLALDGLRQRPSRAVVDTELSAMAEGCFRALAGLPALGNQHADNGP